MKLKDSKSLGAALGAGILVTVSLLPQARGEMVYESDLQQQQQAADREALRSAISSSQKAQATVQAQQPVAIQQAPVAVAPAPVAPALAIAAPVAVAPVAPAPQAAVASADQGSAAIGSPAPEEVQNLSKAELLRRERVRDELKNEDLLQERLEQLRLRDENRRTQELLGAGGSTDAPADGVGAALPAAQAPQAVAVVAPVTDHPGVVAQAPAAPVVAAPVVAAPAPQQVATAYPLSGGSDQIATSQAMSVSMSGGIPASERSSFFVSPLAGVANMNVNSAYAVTGQFAAGVGLGINSGDNLAFIADYTYAQYGLGLSETNPFYGSLGNSPEYLMKQNSIEAGLKLSVLGPDSRIRPFIGAEGGYEWNYVNYAPNLTAGLGSLAPDYTANGILGSVMAGLDVKLSNSISFEGLFKYTNVFSYNETTPLTFYSMYNMGAMQEQAYSATLAQSSYYAFMGGLTFAF